MRKETQSLKLLQQKLQSARKAAKHEEKRDTIILQQHSLGPPSSKNSPRISSYKHRMKKNVSKLQPKQNKEKRLSTIMFGNAINLSHENWKETENNIYTKKEIEFQLG